jgi:Cys-tRNA(Pro)/Cys-tRNA(Cys) deacylase
MAAQATRATVALTKQSVEFRVHAYDHDPRAAGYGTEAVERLGLDPHRTFKTLLAAAGDRLVVGVVPVSAMLDLKALAAAAGMKSLTMADAAVAERATGYVIGGISPIGQQRRLPTFIDESATAFDTVFCSAGRRGLEVELAPDDLRRAVDGTFAAIARR